MNRLEDAPRLDWTKAMLARFQAPELPERLAVPAAVLIILATSLLLWLAIGSIVGRLAG